MLKRGLKDNPHNLQEEDFVELTKATQNYSGSDLAILVRDAVYEPVRRLQTAKKFKQVGDKWCPCRQGEDGKPGTWLDFPKDAIDIGIITKQDILSALKRTKPSVDQKQLAEYEEFTSTFGQEG